MFRFRSLTVTTGSADIVPVQEQLAVGTAVAKTLNQTLRMNQNSSYPTSVFLTLAITVAAICAFIVLPTRVHAAALSYTVTDLGTLGGSTGFAEGINATGQVVGAAYTANNAAYHAFRYSGGIMSDIGTLGGTSSVAYGINDSGQVTGYAYTANNAGYHAFVYSSGVMSDLGTLGGSVSQGYGINASGQIAGSGWTTGDAAWHAFRYTGGTMTDLGTLGGNFSFAYGINDSGQVVGDSYVTGNINRHAYLYSNGSISDLGTFGGSFSTAISINNSGQVVGGADTTGNTATHAFLFSGGIKTDLGTLGGQRSFATGINASGVVAGVSNFNGNNNLWHAFIYTAGAMYDLNNLIPTGTGITDITLDTSTNAINSVGQIAAQGSVGGNTHALLLTPTPEPASAMLFLSGIAVLAGRRLRRNTLV